MISASDSVEYYNKNVLNCIVDDEELIIKESYFVAYLRNNFNLTLNLICQRLKLTNISAVKYRYEKYSNLNSYTLKKYCSELIKLFPIKNYRISILDNCISIPGYNGYYINKSGEVFSTKRNSIRKLRLQKDESYTYPFYELISGEIRSKLSIPYLLSLSYKYPQLKNKPLTWEEEKLSSRFYNPIELTGWELDRLELIK